MLTQQKRQQLDKIVEQMVRENEPDNMIQFVVDDFKAKYENEDNISSESKGIFAERGTKLKQQIERISGEDKNLGIGDIPEVALNVAGQGIGTGFDIIGKGISKVTPEFIKKPLGQAVEKIVTGVPGIEETIQKYQEWKTKNPRIAQDLESFVDIASLIPIGKGSKVAGEKALSIAGQTAGKVATKIETGMAKQTFEEALDIIRPTLTKKEKASALGTSRGVVTNKILPRQYETISLKPTKVEEEMARVVTGIVSKSKNPIDNISSLSEASYSIGKKIRIGLEQSDAIWNKNELKSKLSTIEKPITVKSDATINNQANNFTKAVMKLADEADKKPVGILDVRQEFDQLVQKEFPNIYDKEMTPMRQYISSMRKTLNEFAESKLPEGKLPDGTTMKEELRRQHLMLDSIENIAEKTANAVDASIVKRAMRALRQNPLVSGITGGILTYGALVGMFSNPVVIGTLALGGTYKLGKTIITSRILKESLVKILRSLENAGKTVDAKAIQEMISQLPE